MGKPARNCCSGSPENKCTPDAQVAKQEGECNGNSVHCEEKAVRQHFHNNGASAGICVEDLHESEVNRKVVKEHRPCTFNARYKYEKKNEDGEKKGQNPEFTDFWKLLHGKHSAFEAIGLSGAIALCVELSHYTCIRKIQHTDDKPKDGCLLRRLTSCIQALSGHTFSPVAHVLPHGTQNANNISLEISEENAFQETRNLNEVQPGDDDSSVYLSDPKPSVESLKEETRFAFYDFPRQNARGTDRTPEKRNDQEFKTSSNEKPNKQIQADTSVPVLSIEEAFAEFEEICRKYTGVGKGIMGNQAAMRGNVKSAASLWREATSLGHSKSFFNLALCYEHGKGVKKDLKEAIRLYEHAVKEGHLQAMYNLGILYMDGTGQSSSDTTRALELMTAAAEQGLMEAQKYLGVYYSEDNSEDAEKAAQYMKMAADQQDAESQYFLAMFYEHGYGVDLNTCKAVYLYNKAAESGNTDAMYSLALYHLDGIGGLPQDRHCAKRLLKKAADLGNKQAQQKLDEVEHENCIDQVTYHTSQNKHASDLTHLLKMSMSVSTPCLSELVRESFKQVKDKVLYDPVSEAGTVSQIYTQLMIPRGMTLVPLQTQLSNVSESSKDNESDSDSGVMFQIGKDFDTFDREDEFEDDSGNFEHTHKSEKCRFEHSISMPDMMTLACV